MTQSKNIHLIPTVKPSKLAIKDSNNKLEVSEKNTLFVNGFGFTPQNIYITNDEEIKEGDWVYCTERKLFGKVIEIQLAKFKSDTSMLYFEINNEEIWCKLFNCKKIILTTDQELISDGVQAIDDEFLEWFVKNPSCEGVEVEEEDYSQKCRECGETVKRGYNCKKECFMKSGNFIPTDKNIKYKIIIPKEEPKQETFEDYLQRLKERRTEDDYKYTDEDFEKYKEYISDCCKNGMSVYKCLEFMYFAEKDIDNQLFNREHKQETIEEAGARIYPINIVSDGHDTNMLCRTGFYIGYELAQERSYSEEEVFNLLMELSSRDKNSSSGTPHSIAKWFEQFKKK